MLINTRICLRTDHQLGSFQLMAFHIDSASMPFTVVAAISERRSRDIPSLRSKDTTSRLV